MSIEFWSEYFDVTQDEVTERLMSCINPTSTILLEKVEEKPDLYGPVWICNTLIIMLAISGTFLDLLKSMFIGSKVPEFDFTKVGFAVSLVYGAFAFFPIAFILVNKVFGSNIPVFKAASIYGYSLSAFIGAAILSIINISFIRVLAFIGAGAHSILFLLVKFRQ